jgi:hypothetical protein
MALNMRRMIQATSGQNNWLLRIRLRNDICFIILPFRQSGLPKR